MRASLPTRGPHPYRLPEAACVRASRIFATLTSVFVRSCAVIASSVSSQRVTPAPSFRSILHALPRRCPAAARTELLRQMQTPNTDTLDLCSQATLVLSNGHQETIELPPVELIMNATNHEERQSVRDKFPELFKKAASSSTSGKPKDKTRHPIGSSSGRPGTAKGDRDRDREGESKRQGSGSSSARSRSRSRARDEHSRHDKPKSAGAEEMPMPSVGAISAPSSAVAPRQRKSRRPHTAGGDSSRRPLLSGGENEQPPPLSPVLRKSSREQPSSGTQPIPIPIPSTPTPTQHRSQSHGSSTTSLALPITPRSTSSVNLVSISGAAAAVVSPLDSKPESDLARSTAKASDVLAWEAELERIEARSRQRTVQMASSPGAASRKTLFVSVSPT